MKNTSDKFFYFLKKATQILLSVSVFSFLFSHESSLSTFLVLSYDYITSNCSVKLFTYTTERNYIFLLCNGILVLIIQTSGLISKVTPAVRFAAHNHKGVGHVSNDHIHDHDHGSTIESANVNNVGEVEEAIEEKEVDASTDHVEVKHVTDDPSPEVVEEEDDDDDDEEGFSTDELNKKCEDFIKKMKQELQGV